VSKYAVIISADAPPTLAVYLGFNNLKKQMGIDTAEVACRFVIDGIEEDIKVVMLVDEEGKLKQKPLYNEMASALTTISNAGNVIVGPAAIVSDEDEHTDGLSLNEAQYIINCLLDLPIAKKEEL